MTKQNKYLIGLYHHISLTRQSNAASKPPYGKIEVYAHTMSEALSKVYEILDTNAQDAELAYVEVTEEKGE